VGRPEHQPRRRLGTGEEHGRGLITNFVVRKRLAGFGILQFEQQIQEVAMARRFWLGLPLYDDRGNGGEPFGLKPPALSERESKRVFARRETIEQTGTSGSLDVLPHQRAQLFTHPVLGHREQGAQHGFERGILERLGEINGRLVFDAVQQVPCCLVEMRHQHVDARRRKCRRKQFALTPPLRSFGQEKAGAADQKGDSAYR
jgi:hypothetical protein